MELRNWEFNTAGSAISGADVFVYEASLTHPNATSILNSTTTNSDGMWAFAGLTNTAKDVKVVYQSKTKWYKGLTKHSVGIVFVDDHETADFQQLVGQASVAAPGVSTALGRIYMKTSGKIFGRYENGSEYQVADFAGATGVLKAAGWGTVATTDIAANAVTQYGIGSGSAVSPTTSSASLADCPQMSVTLTTTGGDVLVWFTGAFFPDTDPQGITLALRMDSGSDVFRRDTNGAANRVITLSTMGRFTGVSAGSHTFYGRWAVSGGIGTAYNTQRDIIALELKR